MRIPLTWLAEHVAPAGPYLAAPDGWDVAALADRLVMTGTEIEAVHSIGSEAGGSGIASGETTEAETVLELEVTPNRPDCLGLYGVAREVHAVTGLPLGPEPWADDAQATGSGKVDDFASVTVEAPELCPRFTARVFTGVAVGPSPPWLKARLSAAGQRPINNVVDVTNYVMLLTGQPLHAFDLDRVPGGALTVRTAREGETVTTLDGVERELDAGVVAVCDAEGPAAIAGIMGGASSEVSEDTSRVLLEVANWDGPNILASSRRLGLRSEASSRFEKQLHPALCERAQRIASRLLIECCGAALVPGTIDVDAGRPEAPVVELRSSRPAQLLGMSIDAGEQTDYLERLGCEVEAREGGDGNKEDSILRVTIPPDRHFDLTREADLVEEVGRVHGLWRLPATLPSVTGGGEIPASDDSEASGDAEISAGAESSGGVGRTSGAESGGAGGSGGAAIAGVGGLTRAQALRRRAEDTLVGLGFDEIVGWSFTDPGERERLGLNQVKPFEHGPGPPVRIANPLSEEQSVMRATLLGSLLDAAAHNRAHGAERIALFESGRVYEAPKQGVGETFGAPAGASAGAASEPPQGSGVGLGGSGGATSDPSSGSDQDRRGTGVAALNGTFPGKWPPPAHEEQRVAALSAGPLRPSGWEGSGEAGGFFALKGIVEALARRFGAELRFSPVEPPFLHPGKAASIYLADPRARLGDGSNAGPERYPGQKSAPGTPIGWIGELHPSVLGEWELPDAVAFELELGPLFAAAAAGEEVFDDIAPYPAVRQDLAVVVDEDTPAAEVESAVAAAGAPLLRQAAVFDHYRGEQLGEGRKSLTLRLEFQAEDRTLAEDEVAALRPRIESALAGIGGSVRE